MNPLTIAVLTGGHAFDVPNFHRLFRRLVGVDAYIQTMEDFAAAPAATRDGYDVVLFYHMLRDTPSEGGKLRAALEHLAETGQGLVLLHHAILGFPKWPAWRELSGIDPALESYHHDEPMRIYIAAPAHPVAAGLADWELVDETYVMHEPDPGSEILLRTDHPKSVQAIAWARAWGKSRVVGCALGHDHTAWSSPGFERVLGNAIRWVGNTP